LSENGLYYILVLNNRVSTQTMIEDCIVHTFDRSKPDIANENAPGFDSKLARKFRWE